MLLLCPIEFGSLCFSFDLCWIVVFPVFICVQAFLFPLTSSVTNWLFSSILFSLHVCVVFPVLFLIVDFQSHSIVTGKDAWYYFSLLRFAETHFVPSMSSILKNVPCALQKDVCSVALGGMFFTFLLSPPDLMGLMLGFPY